MLSKEVAPADIAARKKNEAPAPSGVGVAQIGDAIEAEIDS